MGKQLVIILDNQGVKKSGKLTEEEQGKLEALAKAQAQKMVLEDIMYNTFIDTSESFEAQMKELAKHVESTKAWEWEDVDQMQKFYKFLASIYNEENGIPRVMQMFSLMMCATKADVTWIDEMTEALKNCANGLDSYITMC